MQHIAGIAERVEWAGALRGEDRTKVPKRRRDLEESWETLAEWIDLLTSEKGATGEMLFGQLWSLLVAAHYLGSATVVEPSTIAYARRERAAGAREARKPRTAKRHAEIRLAILEVERRETLVATLKFAGSIDGAVSDRLATKGQRPTSARTVQRVIQTILKERGDEADQP